MKKIFKLITAVLLAATGWAQSPEKMSYQAVIRNSSDQLITNQAIGMRISILQDSPTGTEVYKEIYNPNPQTNANGLVSIEIGTGIPLTGTFSTINWATGTFFLKTETDPTGGTNYTITGTSQLLSVPYALHATTAESVTGTITETDPVFNEWDKDFDDLINKPDLSGFVTNAALTTGLDTKVDKEEGKGLSSEDYTAANKKKLNTLPDGTIPGQMNYWNGSAWVNVPPANSGQVLTFSNGVPVWSTTAGWNDVINPYTGKTWMDRNLGANQVATSSTDAASYGDLYQWGRQADGHQIRTSGTTSTLSSSDTPMHENFILAPASPYDWRSPQNTSLWQGVNGVNNPCPGGYRVPTEAELNAERLSWSSNDAAGAFGSPLKFPLAGIRLFSNGLLGAIGSNGFYWSSTVDGTLSHSLDFNSSNANMSSQNRARGFSIRCIKD